MEKLTGIDVEQMIALGGKLDFQNADLTNIKLDGANLKETILELEVA
jgi:uncharacterized protein YjbI with pentapeptide repeats